MGRLAEAAEVEAAVIKRVNNQLVLPISSLSCHCHLQSRRWPRLITILIEFFKPASADAMNTQQTTRRIFFAAFKTEYKIIDIVIAVLFAAHTTWMPGKLTVSGIGPATAYARHANTMRLEVYFLSSSNRYNKEIVNSRGSASFLLLFEYACRKF